MESLEAKNKQTKIPPLGITVLCQQHNLGVLPLVSAISGTSVGDFWVSFDDF